MRQTHRYHLVSTDGSWVAHIYDLEGVKEIVARVKKDVPGVPIHVDSERERMTFYPDGGVQVVITPSSPS